MSGTLSSMRLIIVVAAIISTFGYMMYGITALQEANAIIEREVTGACVQALEEASRGLVFLTNSTTNSLQTESKVESANRWPLLEEKELWATFYANNIEGCIGCRPYYDENDELYFLTASGDVFDDTALTGAANWLPLGSKVRVTWGSKSVVVTINDRMLSDYKIDLSKAAFEQLGDLDIGSIFVTVEIL